MRPSRLKRDCKLTALIVILTTLVFDGIIVLLYCNNLYGDIDLSRITDLTNISNLEHKSFLPIIIVAILNIVLVYGLGFLKKNKGEERSKHIIRRSMIVLFGKLIAVTVMFYGGWYMFVATKLTGNLLEQVRYMNRMFQNVELIQVITYIPLLFVLLYRKKST